MGDLNFDLLADYPFADDLNSTFGLMQLVTEATRVTSTTTALLYHMYMLGLDNASATVKELHIADHCAVVGTLMVHTAYGTSNLLKNKMCCFRSMKNLDQATLADDLTAVQWVEAIKVQEFEFFEF